MPYKDKEKKREYNKNYHEKNRDKLNEKQRKYGKINYHKNIEKERLKSKNWEKNNPEKHHLRVKRYQEKHPEKLIAHRLAKQIPLKPSCEICHSTNKLQKHHWRYDKPLLVVTLCQECHTAQHYPVPLITN